MFNNITNEKKLEMLETARDLHEQVLYESLIRLGIDPSTFSIDNFDSNSENYPPNVEEIIQDAVRSIAALTIIYQEMDLISGAV